MTTRAQIIATARSAEGTPWVHQRCNPPLSTDCVGLIAWTGRQHSLPFMDLELPNYQAESQWHEFLRYFRERGVEIPVLSAQPADVVCFRQRLRPCHCGILTESALWPKFIHSSALRGRVVEEAYTPAWRRLTVSAFSFRGLED